MILTDKDIEVLQENIGELFIDLKRGNNSEITGQNMRKLESPFYASSTAKWDKDSITIKITLVPEKHYLHFFVKSSTEKQ